VKKRTGLGGYVHWQEQPPAEERKLEVIPDKVSKAGNRILCKFTSSIQPCHPYLICTNLQILLAHSNETLPHIISTFTKWVDWLQSGSRPLR